MAEKTKKGKRVLIVLCAVIVFLLSIVGVLQIGVVSTQNTWTRWKPDYAKTDITPLLEKSVRTDEDYRVLYEQTGLTKLGIDDLLRVNPQRILDIQTAFFLDYETVRTHFGPFTYMEEINGYTYLPLLKDGDILVSASTYTSFFRYGHSALVVEGATGTILESVSAGYNSALGYAETFSSRVNFLVLRPKADECVKAQVVEYAKTELLGKPYLLTTGIFSPKYYENGVGGTHCAHLVWQAYRHFGIDLDATGGAVVTPQDLARSPSVELVQAFGFDLDYLWS